MNKLFKITNDQGVTGFCTWDAESADTAMKILQDAAAENKWNGTVETFDVGKMPLSALPEDIQDKVRGTLRAYDRCRVVFEYGKFSAGAGCCVKAHYNYDHFVCGEYFAADVYTPEERRQNFIEEFGYAPAAI